MKPKRSKTHHTLTETATQVVRELCRIPGVSRIAPGEIRVVRKQRSGVRYVTITHHAAGFELSISGQNVQRVSVHTKRDSRAVASELRQAKRLREFRFQERARFPGR